MGLASAHSLVSATFSFLCPQAFSHFTFERSGHQLIVVDIQGVGDLYTDPQIHTEKGTDFGDGNLGRWARQPVSTETTPSLRSPSSRTLRKNRRMGLSGL